MKRRALWHLSAEGFLGQTSRIAVGVAMGQGVVALSYPIVTRLYTPSSLGVLAVFSGLLATLTGVVSLRYEQAVPLVDAADDSSLLLRLALGISFVSCVLLLVILVFLRDWLASVLGIAGAGGALLLLPPALCLAATSQAVSFMIMRRQRFGWAGWAAAGQGISQALTQVVLGLAGGGATALIAGDATGWAANSGALCLGARDTLRRVRGNRGRTRFLARRFRRFPLFAAPAGLVNSLGQQIPTLLVAAFYGPAAAGLLALAQVVLGIPAAFIGQPVSQVFVGRASKILRSGKGGPSLLARRTAWRMLLIGIPFTASLVLLAPRLFSLVFGPRWVEAGDLTRVLALGYLAQFVVSPVSSAINLSERQDWQLAWDIGRLGVVAGAIVSAHSLGAGLIGAAASYGAAMVLSYLALYVLVLIVDAHRRER